VTAAGIPGAIPHPAPHGGDGRSANVAEVLVAVAAEHPDRPALIGADGSPRWTFNELAGRAARIASGLTRRGLRPGGRVAVFVRDPEDAMVVAVATLWAGGTLVAPPASSGWRTAVAAAARTRPTAIVADPLTFLALVAVPGLAGARVRVVTGRRHWPGTVTLDGLNAHEAMPSPAPRPGDAPALVSWTTGTTGRPHAVLRTHGVLAAQHAAIRTLRAPRAGDVDLVGLPTMALHDLGCGVAIVFPPPADRDADGSRLRALVTRAGVTTAVGFPVLFERLVSGARPGGLPGLRSIHVGGAPVPRGLLDRLAVVAPNATVVIVYGATEVEPIAAIEATELGPDAATPGQGLLVGRPCEGVDLRLQANDATIRHDASDVDTGRILVRGARVAHDPVRSDREGWLDTGDLGRVDDQGRLWLLGRASSVGRGDLAPASVEEPIVALPDVDAAALVRVPGSDGTRLVLAVEPARGARPAAVRRHVTELASEQGWSLDVVVLVRRLPRDTRSGKIDYRRLSGLLG
jgi:acyl-CoA synthetase (AMP-forming)/AMP-acid ligase II